MQSIRRAMPSFIKQNALLKSYRAYKTKKQKERHPFGNYYYNHVYLDEDESARKIFDHVKTMTMIGPSGVLANLDATDYVVKNKISGDFVECGVWMGGSIMAMALRLIELGDTGRNLYLYDTFAGMTKPGEHDIGAGGKDAQYIFSAQQKQDYNEWCYGPLDKVKENLASTGYPEDKIHLIQGDVCETLKTTVPDHIALLRLDTDFYDSTKAEFEHLYPKISYKAPVIIDDYGDWQGARKATNEFFEGRAYQPLFQRIDQSRRMFFKLDEE